MVRTLFLILNAALLFFMISGPSLLSFPEIKQAYAQAVQPSSEKPARPRISFAGGPGDTLETAVIISGAPDSQAGISAEYYYLEKKFGRRNVDWKLKRQAVLHMKGKIYDSMEIELKDGSRKTIFFDITEFFGKM